VHPRQERRTGDTDAAQNDQEHGKPRCSGHLPDRACPSGMFPGPHCLGSSQAGGLALTLQKPGTLADGEGDQFRCADIPRLHRFTIPGEQRKAIGDVTKLNRSNIDGKPVLQRQAAPD
jgi:hypothetical protein